MPAAKKIVSCLAVLFLVLPLTANSNVKITDEDFSYLFNSRITEEEKSALSRGEFVFNSISSVKKVRINKIEETNQDIEIIREVNPNHLIEVIKIIPYQGNENLIERISKILQDINAYTKIPYYSIHHKKYFKLFEKAKILSMQEENGIQIIDEQLLMNPFKSFNARVTAENRSNYYFYTLKNTEKVKYKFLNAIKKEKMVAGISVFRYGENWVIYALGGAYIFHGPFFYDFVEDVCCGRIKSFVIFMFKRLEEFPSEDEEN